MRPRLGADFMSNIWGHCKLTMVGVGAAGTETAEGASTCEGVRLHGNLKRAM